MGKSSQEGMDWEGVFFSSVRLRKLHTLAVYDKFRIVTVRSHEYCFVLYLVFGPCRSAIDDFEQLVCRTLVKCNRDRGTGQTNRVGDAVCESHKVELIALTLPVRSERKDQSQHRRCRIFIVVRLRDVFQR